MTNPLIPRRVLDIAWQMSSAFNIQCPKRLGSSAKGHPSLALEELNLDVRLARVQTRPGLAVLQERPQVLPRFLHLLSPFFDSVRFITLIFRSQHPRSLASLALTYRNPLSRSRSPQSRSSHEWSSPPNLPSRAIRQMRTISRKTMSVKLANADVSGRRMGALGA